MSSKSCFRLPEAQLPKTAAMVRREFNRKGLSVSEWARSSGVDRQVVFDLLRGKLKGNRGEAHRAAVLLGMKEGVIPNDDEGSAPPLTKVVA